MSTGKRTTATVLGARIDVLSWEESIHRIATWGQRRESRYVCACNVHSIVTANADPVFREIINSADMATADGMPVAWSLRKLGFGKQERINGPDLTWRLLEHAAAGGQSVFFYGSSEQTLCLLKSKIEAAFPTLTIAGMLSPPYRPLTDAEDQQIIEEVNASEAALVFVGLGCPKQEVWMAQHRGKIKAVMLGVGAAFDYHAGTLRRAPVWMQRAGLEWAYRLLKEPRRLWRRYLSTNTQFLFSVMQQLYARWRLTKHR
jgi:N-acetylglucosaminyldiphosphoundecaprenol N-acetyl-beta-D-mannosaminyltransferase